MQNKTFSHHYPLDMSWEGVVCYAISDETPL